MKTGAPAARGFEAEGEARSVGGEEDTVEGAGALRASAGHDMEPAGGAQPGAQGSGFAGNAVPAAAHPRGRPAERGAGGCRWLHRGWRASVAAE